MPRTPTNYNTNATVIYNIYCLSPEVTFNHYGSTTNFISRKSKHKSMCKNNSNLRLYKEIEEHGV